MTCSFPVKSNYSADINELIQRCHFESSIELAAVLANEKLDRALEKVFATTQLESRE